MNRDRLFSSTVMILLSFFAIINDWVFIGVLLLLTVAGLYEFFYLVKKKGIPIYSYTGIAIGVIIPLSIFFRFQPTKGWELFFICLALIMIFIMQLARKDNSNAVVGISTTLFGILYVSWFFSFLIKIRFLLPGVPGAGMKLVGFLLLITKSGDMGALLIGTYFGKHPLLFRVSPKKTIEGCIGSFAASGLVAILAIGLFPPQLGFSFWQVGLVGMFFGGIGQIGDMSESLIKRDFNVKDSGKMLPALGGALDAIDSLLFSAPAFYFYMSHILTSV